MAGSILVPLGRISAVVAPAVGFSSILLSISVSPWFSWQNNALSDLGVSGAGAVVFNVGLIVAGLLTVLFGLGLWSALRRTLLGMFGAMLFVLDGMFLSAVGFFPETSGPVHFYVSVGFFVTLGLSILLLGAQWLLTGLKTHGLLSVVVVVVGVLAWLVPRNGVAIPEAVSGVLASCWSVLTGFRLRKL